jgi:type II secretory pathway component PulM
LRVRPTFVEKITKARPKRLLCKALLLDDAEMSSYNAAMKTFTTTIISLLAIFAFSLTPARAGQPHMRQALQQLRAALAQLQAAVPDKAGWRVRAIQSTKSAIAETQSGIAAGAQ